MKWDSLTNSSKPNRTCASVRNNYFSSQLGVLLGLSFIGHQCVTTAFASEPILGSEMAQPSFPRSIKQIDEGALQGELNAVGTPSTEFRVNLEPDGTPEEVRLSERVLPAGAEKTFGDFMLEAQQCCRSHEYEKSFEQLSKALAVLQKYLSATDTRVAKCRMRLGAVQFLNRNFEEAINQLNLSAGAYECHQLYNENCLLVYQLLAESNYEQLNLAEAENYACKALSLAADSALSTATTRQEIMHLQFKIALAQNSPSKVLSICDDQLQLLSFLSEKQIANCKNPREKYEWFLRDNRFWALLALGRKDEASEEYARVRRLNDRISGNHEFTSKLQESLSTIGKSKTYVDGCVAQNGMLWSPERMPIKIFVDDSLIAPEILSVVARITENALSKWNDATGGALSYVWVRHKNDANMIITFKKQYRPDGTLARTSSLPVIDRGLVPDVLNAKITIDLFLQETPIPSGLLSYGKPFPAYNDQDAFDISRRRSLSPRAEAELSAVVLHEMGHALGIRHSNDPRDLMYFSRFCTKELSARDIATAKLWYSKHNESAIRKAKERVTRSVSPDTLKYLRDNPNDYFCLTEYGRIALKLRNYSEARKCFARAIDLAPKNPNAHFNLGLLYMATNRSADAIAQFNKCRECDPAYASAEVLANIATCAFRLKQYGEASDYSDLALQKQPSFQRLHHMYAASLYEQKRFEKALEEIVSYLRVYPSSEAGYLLEGKILSELHDYDNSIKAFDQSLALNPKNRIARHQRDLAAHLQLRSGSSTLKSWDGTGKSSFTRSRVQS